MVAILTGKWLLSTKVILIDSRSKIGGVKPSFFMRKLLIPLLAALALPTAVNASGLVSRETTQKGNHFLITRLVENFFSNKNDPETRTKFQGH